MIEECCRNEIFYSEKPLNPDKPGEKAQRSTKLLLLLAHFMPDVWRLIVVMQLATS